MAAAGKKKQVNKDDLRRLMKEKQGSMKTSSKTIDHPLAKYNSIGQLICIVCQQQVKTNLLWAAHINGRSHKENIARLKAEKERRETPTVTAPTSQKRKATGDLRDVPSKSQKGSTSQKQGLPDDFFDEKIKPKSILKTAPKSILKNFSASSAIVPSYPASDEEEDDREKAPAPVPAPAATTSTVQGLPSDFFDQGVAPSTSVDGTTENTTAATNLGSMAEQLPEGFFDDPKQDAKIRKVEYKDKMDEEWELFQKAMKEETTVSEAIVEEEYEQREVDRNLEEIDEQMKRWTEVDKLIKKKEEVMSKKEPIAKKQEEDEEEEDLDEQEEFDEFLDWRSKNAWK